MMNAVGELRKLIGDGTQDTENFDEIDFLLEEHGEEVDSEFEEGGRWTNFEHTVYAVQDSFFRLTREVAASEIQDYDGYYYELSEVEPRQVTVTDYVKVKQK